jgi:hypothetical protein
MEIKINLSIRQIRGLLLNLMILIKTSTRVRASKAIIKVRINRLMRDRVRSLGLNE